MNGISETAYPVFKYTELSEFCEKFKEQRNFKKFKNNTCIFEKACYTNSSKARWSSG